MKIAMVFFVIRHDGTDSVLGTRQYVQKWNRENGLSLTDDPGMAANFDVEDETAMCRANIFQGIINQCGSDIPLQFEIRYL